MSSEYGADDEHHGSHPGSTEQQRPPAAKFVDTNDQEDSSGDDLQSTIDASGEERRARLGKSDGLENLI